MTAWTTWRYIPNGRVKHVLLDPDGKHSACGMFTPHWIAAGIRFLPKCKRCLQALGRAA